MRRFLSNLPLGRYLESLTAIIGRRRRDRHKTGPRLPRWLARKMGQEESTMVDDSVPPHTLTARTLEAVAEYIKSGRVKRIVVLTGAGISTAAGIPDFRSPKTGLYANLARLNLPYAEAVFDIQYFRQHPEPFYVLANELYPGKFHPTVSHAFIALLAQKGLLQMLFTQNIDCLERSAGVPSDKIIEAHGSFATQRCIECKTEYADEKMKEHVFAGKVPHCAEKDCNGLVKPDIVFFGEALPKSFEQNSYVTSLADLVLILGTSLSVYPFASLPELASPGKPRVLFNMERVGQLGRRVDDVVELGSCDGGIRKLADLLGWKDELEAFWRNVVGDKEADRQLRSAERGEEEVDEEVHKLADEVEAVLKLNDEPAGESKVARIARIMDGALGSTSDAEDKPVKGAGRIDVNKEEEKGETAEPLLVVPETKTDAASTSTVPTETNKTETGSINVSKKEEKIEIQEPLVLTQEPKAEATSAPVATSEVKEEKAPEESKPVDQARPKESKEKSSL